MIYIEELREKVSQKQQSIIGKKLLLKGLEYEYGISLLPRIILGEFGKPFFIDYPKIHFNISHCDKAVACILSSHPVGIDVECIKELDIDLAKYISSEEEFNKIITSLNPALAFTKLWTEKESYCKLTGQGLDSRDVIRDILKNNPSKFNTIINETGGYVVTSCQNQ